MAKRNFKEDTESVKENAKSKFKANRKGKYDKRKARTNDTKSDRDSDYHKDSGYINNPSDYIPDDNLRRDVGSFSYSSTIGIPTELGGTVDGTNVNVGQEIGNIMSIGFFPYIGINRDTLGYADGMSAINAAGLKLYTQISAVNAKTTQYQPQDLTAAIIAVGEAISLASFITRAYGVAFRFAPRNRKIPKDILLAMGLDADSILDDLANFRMKYNKLITLASGIRMIRSISYFTRCWDQYAHVFYDKGSSMGQLYVTRPIGWLEFNEDYPELGKFEWNTLGNPSSPISGSQLLKAFSDCIETILQSSTFNYVFTDIVNYVTRQGGELLGFSYLPELYQVEPEFSEVFMTQIHNMDWGLADLTQYRIIDDAAHNRLYSSDIFYTTINEKNKGYFTSRILDFPYTDSPTYDDAIDACAFKVLADYATTSDSPVAPGTDVYKSTYVAAAAHVPNDLYVIVVDYVGNSSARKIPQIYEFGATGVSVADAWDQKILETFDVHPMRYMTLTNTGTFKGVSLVGALNFWTDIKYQQLFNMFHYYMLGLFDAEVKGGKSFD